MEKVKHLFTAVTLGALLSSFFWLPAVAEKQYIFLGSNQIADKSLHYVTLLDLFIYNGTGIKPSLLIGIPHLTLLIASIYYAFTRSRKEVIKSKLPAGFVVLIISLFLQFSLSQSLWNLPVIEQIDFPWRFMLLTGFVLSFLSGSIAKIVNKKVALLVIAVSLIYYSRSIKAFDYINRPDEYYTTNDATTTSNDELMPIWVTTKPKDRQSLLIQTDGQVISQYSDSKSLSITVNQQHQQKIILNSLYFPGWNYYVNNRKVAAAPEEETGLVSFILPQGASHIIGKLAKTAVQSTADLISVGTLITVLLFITTRRIFSK